MHAYEYIGRNESGSCQHGQEGFTKKKKIMGEPQFNNFLSVKVSVKILGLLNKRLSSND